MPSPEPGGPVCSHLCGYLPETWYLVCLDLAARGPSSIALTVFEAHASLTQQGYSIRRGMDVFVAAVVMSCSGSVRE